MGNITAWNGRPPVLSGKICYHCGSDQTSKAGWSTSHHLVARDKGDRGRHSSSGRRRAKRRFKCRGCGKFFIEGGSAKTGKRYQRKNIGDLPSKQELLKELRAVAEELGHAPTTLDWVRLRREDSVCPIGWFYEVFGSFLAAVKLAGLKPNYLQEFDASQRAEMLDQLRALSRELGRPIFGEDVMNARRLKKVAPLNHYQLAYKTIPAAIAAAGVGPKLYYTDEEMIAILRELDAKLDRPVLESDIDELYRAGKGPAEMTVIHRFGSLKKARKAACVREHYDKPAAKNGKTLYWQKYTKGELIAQLVALGKRLGKRPTDRDINRASRDGRCASATTFGRMFGSLPDAYRAAGFTETAPNARKWTDDEIVKAVKRLAKKLGRFPAYHDLRRASIAGETPSPGTIVRRIGRLRDIREAM